MIDVFASAPWYVDHIAPIWLALPAAARGRFHVTPRSAPAAARLPNVTSDRISGAGRPTFVVSFGDLRAVTMTGRDRLALGQHGAGQSYSTDHPAYPGGRSQGAASLFLVPNETAAARTRFTYPHARVAVVGCPKLDTLPRREPGGQAPVIAFSFHWDGPSIAPELRTAWLHYRTSLAGLTRTYKVIGHAHPKAMSRVERWYRAAHIETVSSFDEVLRRADVYACDNSSSLFEFAATGRPVIVLNAPMYRRDVEHGLRFWAAAGVGINVDAAHQLRRAIAEAVADPPEVRDAREAALALVYQPRTGSAELAAAALLDWANAPAPAARAIRHLDVRRPRAIVRANRRLTGP